ncbi:hypothetical protein [Desertivirga arenae]|uniref:hypothetical protein n=1 Tax=Desertivirga arenae TaxID=2810309 RepID=UPI001A95B8E8|nr:hypothetical protein [Pedobacter sp. SYSU D00823]
MKKNWEQTVEGSLMFSTDLEDKILVIVSTDFAASVGGNNSTYKAFLLDARDGKVIHEKVIYEGNNDYLTVAEFVVSKNRKTFSLIARETSAKRNFIVAADANGSLWAARKMANNASAIRKFSVSAYDSHLATIDKVFPVLPDGDFIGAAKTINGDLYVAVSEEKKGITIAKFEAGKEEVSAMVLEPFGLSSGLQGQGSLNLITDTHRNNTAYLTGGFTNGPEYTYILNKYDFGTNKEVSFRKSFRKADLKTLEKSFVPLNKQFSRLDLGSVSGLNLLSVAFPADGYLIALSDVRYLPGTPGSKIPPTYTANGILVYNLDSNFVVKSASAIPRAYGNVTRPSFRSDLRDNSWYLFASDEWKAKFAVAKINASSGKIEDLKMIAPEKVGKGHVPDLAEMTITDSQLFLPVKDPKPSLGYKLKYDVHMYRLDWEK